MNIKTQKRRERERKREREEEEEREIERDPQNMSPTAKRAMTFRILRQMHLRLVLVCVHSL